MTFVYLLWFIAALLVVASYTVREQDDATMVLTKMFIISTLIATILFYFLN